MKFFNNMMSWSDIWISSVLTLIIAILLWFLIYTLFRAELKKNICLISSIILIVLLPFIFYFAFNCYAMTSRLLFANNESGEIKLNSSPFKIPKQIKPENYLNYCNQFSDQQGKPITVVYHRFDGVYCGNFWNINGPLATLSYKYLKTNKAEYWATPTLRIIGPLPPLSKTEAVQDIKNIDD